MSNKRSMPASDQTLFERGVRIVEFQERHAADFSALNIAWLEHYFIVEEKDRAQLDHAQDHIIGAGGAILIAENVEGNAVGCVALIPCADGELELAKMAVTKTAQGFGVGRRLMEVAIERARRMGAMSIYLESNSRLRPAISLYEHGGFVHVPPEDRAPSPYQRCDVQMRLVL